MQHNFKTSLSKGKVGEAFLLEKWPELTLLDGLNADFKLPDGRTLELKTDYYNMDETANFFIERISNSNKQSPGGPWQAASKGIDLFAYLYIKNKMLFIFDTIKLVAFLESQSFSLSDVKNKNYITRGIKVPRAQLNHLAEVRDFSNGNN